MFVVVLIELCDKTTVCVSLNGITVDLDARNRCILKSNPTIKQKNTTKENSNIKRRKKRNTILIEDSDETLKQKRFVAKYVLV